MTWTNIAADRKSRRGRPPLQAGVRIKNSKSGKKSLIITLGAEKASSLGFVIGKDLTIYYDEPGGRIALVTEPEPGEEGRRLRRSMPHASPALQTRAVPPWLLQRLPVGRSLPVDVVADTQMFGRRAAILILPASPQPTASRPPDLEEVVR